MMARIRDCLLLLSVVGMASAQGCPNTGGVIAGTALVTLAVVGTILAVVAFIYWKKKKQENAKKAAQPANQGPEHAYDNPTFRGDVEMGQGGVYRTPEKSLDRSQLNEKGFPGYVPCKEYDSPRKNPVQVPLERNGAPSKWLPSVNLRPIHKTGSHSSLDDTTPGDPEVISVSLQSQDIIGLGFNISGSMRDGIYVSQVHNRGPASESGRIKPGDRILSITISFENMVYEDALTILSYASPYPVRLAVQKVQSDKVEAIKASPEAQVSPREGSVLHPIYRSQSMDDVSQIGKESFSFRIRRARSEMKRGSSSKAKEREREREEREREEGKLRKWSGKHDVATDLSFSTGAMVTSESSDSNLSFPDLKIGTSDLAMDYSDVPETKVVVHELPDRTIIKDKNDNEELKPVSLEYNIPKATIIPPGGDVNVDLGEGQREMTISPDSVPTLETKLPNMTAQNKTSKEFMDAYRYLTDEDRMEVLRLSYEGDEASGGKTVTGITLSPAEAPNLEANIKSEFVSRVEAKVPEAEPSLDQLEAELPELEAKINARISELKAKLPEVNVPKEPEPNIEVEEDEGFGGLNLGKNFGHIIADDIDLETETAQINPRRRRRRRRSSNSSNEEDKDNKIEFSPPTYEVKLEDTPPKLPDSPHPEFNLTIPPSPGAEIEVEADVSTDRLETTDLVNQLEAKAGQVELKEPKVDVGLEHTIGSVEEDGQIDMGTNLGEVEMEVPDDEEMRLELGRRLGAFIDIDLGRDGESNSSSDEEMPHMIEKEKPNVVVPSLEPVTLGAEVDDTDVSMEVNVSKGVGIDSSIMQVDASEASSNISVENQPLTAEDEEEVASVRAVLKDYFGDQASWMSRFGFSDKEPEGESVVKSESVTTTVVDGHVTKTHVETVKTEGGELTKKTTFTTDEFDVPSLKAGSLDGKLLKEAKEEIRRRSDSSSQSSNSSLSSRSSSPGPDVSDVKIDASVITKTLEASVDTATPIHASSDDPKRASGGIAYDITTSEFKDMQPQPEPQRTGDHTGGIAYYVSIDEDRFRAVPAKAIYDLDPDDNSRPALVRAQNEGEDPDYPTADVRQSREKIEKAQEGEPGEEEQLHERILLANPPKFTASTEGEMTLGLNVDPNINGNGNGSSQETTPVGSPLKISTKDIIDNRPQDKVTIVEHERRQGTYTLTVNAGDEDYSDSEA